MGRQGAISGPVFASEDAKEGASAFKEKREPGLARALTRPALVLMRSDAAVAAFAALLLPLLRWGRLRDGLGLPRPGRRRARRRHATCN